MKKYRILVVDDDPQWMDYHMKTLNTYFEEVNFEVVQSYGARDAFLKVISASTPFDLVISDMEMEEVADESYAGQWLIKSLKKQASCKNTKMLIVSGAPNLADIGLDLGCDYIPKYNYHFNPALLHYKFIEMFTVN